MLREYAERERFPRNLEYPGERVPHFVDDRGVRCAVGYLIHRDGREGLVERIAATRNTARIPELADGSVWCDPLEEVAGAIGAGYAVAADEGGSGHAPEFRLTVAPIYAPGGGGAGGAGILVRVQR